LIYIVDIYICSWAAGWTLYAFPPVLVASEVTRRFLICLLWTPGWGEHDVLRLRGRTPRVDVWLGRRGELFTLFQRVAFWRRSVYIRGGFFDFQVWMILVIHVLGGNRGYTVADEGGWHALEVGNSGVGSSEASVTTSWWEGPMAAEVLRGWGSGDDCDDPVKRTWGLF